MNLRKKSDLDLRCSFCQKSQDAVGRLITSPSQSERVYICDECIVVCSSIMEDDRPSGAPPGIVLDPDLAEVFPDAASVNDALRHLLDIARRIKPPSAASSPPTFAQTPNEP